MNDFGPLERVADHSWWLAGAVLVIAIAWIVGTRCIGGYSLIRHFPKTAAVAELFLLPLTVIVAGSVVHILLRRAGVTGIDSSVETLVEAVVYLTIAFAAAHLVQRLITQPSEDGEVETLPALQRGILYGCALVAAFILFLVINGYPITGIFVSTGAVAAIIAFAMQRTLGDLFSGIALSVEQPFRLGEWIELEDGTQGKVVDINWRATRLRGWDRATLVVPNGVLAGQRFKNLHGSKGIFAPWYEVKIPADVDPRFAKELLLEAVLRCDKVLKHPLPVVRLMNAQSVPYTYMVWVHFANFPAMFAGREEVYREIHYALKRAGVQIAPETYEIRSRRAEPTMAEPPTTLLALKALDIASLLTDEELEKIAAMSWYQIFDSGTVLLREGETASAFNIIFNGIVESSISLSDGSQRFVERLSPGQYYGITSMVTSNPSMLQFTAVTDVSVITIDNDCLRTVVSDRPDLAEKFAEIVKQRRDAAETARRSANQPVTKLSFQDIVRSIEKSIWEPNRK